jgi:hypothetical protein
MGACRLTNTNVQYDERDCYGQMVLRLSNQRGEHETFLDRARRAYDGLAPLAEAGIMNIVIVHGAFANGSAWSPIGTILEHDRCTVYVVQEPLTSWDADLAATRNVLDRAGPYRRRLLWS